MHKLYSDRVLESQIEAQKKKLALNPEHPKAYLEALEAEKAARAAKEAAKVSAKQGEVKAAPASDKPAVVES